LEEKVVSYDQVYARSLTDPEGFWGEAAQAVHWEKPWDRVLDDSNPPLYRWFAGGGLNTCYNALDRHVEGERCDPDTLTGAQAILKVPVIDHWWQTETGWAIASNCLGIEPLPIKPGSPTKPVPGYDVRVLDEEGHEQPPGEIGRIMIRLPLPPACQPTLWRNDRRFVESYLSAESGYYLTGDAGMKDDDGYLCILSRIDDIINVAGHRLSTGAMEEVLAAHPDVAECAVIGAHDAL
jgi:propionyl-CoA synthetase